MNIAKDTLILRKDDYQILLDYIKGRYGKTLFDRQNAEAMQQELSKAQVVDKEDFPGDAVGLHSRVKVKDDSCNKILDLELVTPDKADIRQNKLSILAPLGVALIGFRQGEKVKWNMPSGERSYTIMEVRNY